MREDLSSGWISELAPFVMRVAGTHTVQLYERDEYLVAVLSRVVHDGLEGGDAVVTIVTPDHQAALDASLVMRGVDVGAARDGERWIALDAVETLARLTCNGVVDEQRLTATVGASMDRASRTTAGGRLRLFGEMVNLLWRRDDRHTALAFEAVWELERTRRSGFSILCAYALNDFDAADDAASLDAVCRHHTHVVPAEDAPDHAPERGFRVEVECTVCGHSLLVTSRIGESEAAMLADHLRRRHPGTLGPGPAMLGDILRRMSVRQAIG